MKDWNNTSSEEKYLRWRNLREEVRGIGVLEQRLEKIAEFFCFFPIGARSIDFYTPSTWPSPWELLNNNRHCENTVSLLMYHTLKMSGDTSKVELRIIDDGRDRYIVPFIDKEYILNYELGKIAKYTDIKNSIKVVDIIDESAIISVK